MFVTPCSKCYVEKLKIAIISGCKYCKIQITFEQF